MTLEHIGIAVKDLEKAKLLYQTLLQVPPYKDEYVESQDVWTSFFKAGETKVELLWSENETSVINKFIEKRGEGMHHMAFEVQDIHAEMERLKAEGFRLLYEEPQPGADNKLICFIHPKDTGGTLIELCQDKG